MSRTARRRRQRIRHQLNRAHRRLVVEPVSWGMGILSATAHPAVVRLRLTLADLKARYEHVVRLRDEGLTYDQIGVELGLSRSRIGQIINNPPAPERLDDEIVDLHLLRYRPVDIARQLGIEQSLVRRRLEKAARAGHIPPDEPAAATALPWALVTWQPKGERSMAEPKYFSSEAEAMEAASTLQEPWTVVDISRAPGHRRRPSIGEFLQDARPMMPTPYPTYRTKDTL